MIHVHRLVLFPQKVPAQCVEGPHIVRNREWLTLYGPVDCLNKAIQDAHTCIMLLLEVLSCNCHIFHPPLAHGKSGEPVEVLLLPYDTAATLLNQSYTHAV